MPPEQPVQEATDRVPTFSVSAVPLVPWKEVTKIEVAVALVATNVLALKAPAAKVVMVLEVPLKFVANSAVDVAFVDVAFVTTKPVTVITPVPALTVKSVSPATEAVPSKYATWFAAPDPLT